MKKMIVRMYPETLKIPDTIPYDTLQIIHPIWYSYDPRYSYDQGLSTGVGYVLEYSLQRMPLHM